MEVEEKKSRSDKKWEEEKLGKKKWNIFWVNKDAHWLETTMISFVAIFQSNSNEFFWLKKIISKFIDNFEKFLFFFFLNIFSWKYFYSNNFQSSMFRTKKKSIKPNIEWTENSILNINTTTE